MTRSTFYYVDHTNASLYFISRQKSISKDALTRKLNHWPSQSRIDLFNLSSNLPTQIDMYATKSTVAPLGMNWRPYDA